uniref:Uncharacterized protein n=1 Tax=Arundo donax TaxID=35708 RepID=A0A0A9HBC3_ARUDO
MLSLPMCRHRPAEQGHNVFNRPHHRPAWVQNLGLKPIGFI